MITIQLLEDNDVVLATDLCRPLLLETMSGGHSDYYSFESEYSGAPINNVKWTYVYQVFGTIWFNKKVIEFNTMTPYEFMRGNITDSHLYGKTRADIIFEYETEYLKTIITIGKYKGLTFDDIRNKDSSYFLWACDQDIIKSRDNFIREYK